MAKQGVSIREYARRRGVSHEGVRKAIIAGRITTYPDGSIEPALADKQWASNTDQTKPKNSVTGNPTMRAGDNPESQRGQEQQRGEHEAPQSGPSYVQARAIREGFVARLAKLEFEQKVGKLVSADEVRVAAFNASRRARDMLMTIPDRIAPLYPSIQNELHAALAEEIERVCKELANVKGY